MIGTGIEAKSAPIFPGQEHHETPFRVYIKC